MNTKPEKYSQTQYVSKICYLKCLNCEEICVGQTGKAQSERQRVHGQQMSR